MEILWPAVVVGAFGVLAGAAMTRWRVQFARFFAEAHEEVFDDRTASIRRATTPSVVIPVGVVVTAIGLTGIAMAICAPAGPWEIVTDAVRGALSYG